MHAIVARDLTKKYGNHLALRAVNFELPEGEILGVIGPKGAGKSTLVQTLAGFCAPTIGSAKLFETADQPVGVRCGVTGGDVHLYEKLTAQENIVFFGKVSGLKGAQVLERASLLFRALGIWQFKDVPVRGLGVSAFRKLCVAVAMIANPKVLLLDEIAQGVDDRTVCEIYDFLTDCVRQEGLTVLVTAESAEYMSFCHSFLILSQGEVAAKGDFETLMKKAGLQYQVSLKTFDGKLNLAGDCFTRNAAGYYVKPIAAEAEMAEIIERVVFLGNKLLEARMVKPTLTEICARYTDKTEQK